MSNILFVVSNLKVGGLQKIVTLISSKLSEFNSVSLFVFNKGEFYQTDLRIEHSEKNIGHFALNMTEKIRKYISKKLSHKEELNNFYYRRLVNSIKKNNIQTIILTEYSILYAPKLRKQFNELKIIIWIHNNYNIYFNEYFKNYRNSLMESIKIANKVVVLTELDKISFSRHSKNVIKIINPLSIDPQGLSSSLLENNISITCRYSIDHKGLDYLIKVSKSLPKEWKISIAGTGTKKEIAELLKMIKLNNVENSIVLLGSLKGKKLLDHYKNSSIYIMTSRWEGMPLVLVEAMSFGLPVISFENSGSNEILENGKYGILVEQGNVEEFSKKLNCMISNYERRKEYSKKSLQRVKDFEISRIVKQWEEII